MDVVLLSAMIKELLLDRDTLSLPGLGTFAAESMPASFSDRGYTINPPYRRLGFSAAQSNDGLLAGLYARSNAISEQEADTILRTFSEGLATEIKASRSVELPGLGRLRSTREGHLFFVPAPDLDITPDACGLTSVSLKTHSAVSLPEIADQVGNDAKVSVGSDVIGLVGNDAKVATGNDERKSRTQIVDSCPAEQKNVLSGTQNSGSCPEEVGGTEAGSVSQNSGRPWPHERGGKEGPGGLGGTPTSPLGVQGDDRSHRVRCEAEVSGGTSGAVEPSSVPCPRNKAVIWALASVAAVVLVIGGFVALSRLAPDFTDRLLYTPEQLAIINTPEDGLGLPR